jgi:hypothetical protein
VGALARVACGVGGSAFAWSEGGEKGVQRVHAFGLAVGLAGVLDGKTWQNGFE